MIIAPAELELTRPNIFTKLPDFTTRTAEYDIATAQFSPFAWFFFLFFHIRVRLSQREDHFITPRKQSVGLFIPYRYNLQQRGYSTLMNDTCIMRGICLDINIASAGCGHGFRSLSCSCPTSHSVDQITHTHTHPAQRLWYK